MQKTSLLTPANHLHPDSNSMRRIYLLITLYFIAIAGCTTSASSPAPSHTLLPPTFTRSPTDTPELTPIPNNTSAPTITNSPAPSPTPSWVWYPPGQVIAPILLYHHIQDGFPFNRFYVTPNNFALQMQSLLDWGYTPIPASLLIEAILFGAFLPAMPIVITFDDGHLDVYENAFPIMDRLGIPGVMYIVSNRIDLEKDFINSTHIKEMIASDWEIGSHGISHTDLTQSRDIVRREVLQSRLDLENILTIPIETFAYPFGQVDSYVWQKVKEYGYTAAMGLGKSWTHDLSTLYYLSRIEVHGSTDLETFASMLPWSSAP